MKPSRAFIAVVALLLLALGRITAPTPEPEYRDVIVSHRQIIRLEPDTVVKWRERVVWRTVTRDVTATAPGAAAETVGAFCLPIFTVVDTVEVPGPVPALIRSGTYDGRKLTLWEAQADGDLVQETFNARAPFRFTITDKAFVQSSRWWWLDDARNGALVLGAGFLLGRAL